MPSHLNRLQNLHVGFDYEVNESSVETATCVALYELVLVYGSYGPPNFLRLKRAGKGRRASPAGAPAFALARAENI